MTVELPPALFYGLGLLLIVFGTLRAHQLGWQRRLQERASGGEGDDATARTASGAARRHIMFGVLWIVMGLFLVISTYLKSRR
jgi:hypothetical protein